MEYELKKKIHITCPHCERAIETEIELELDIKDKKSKDKKSKDKKSKDKKSKDKKSKDKKSKDKKSKS